MGDRDNEDRSSSSRLREELGAYYFARQVKSEPGVVNGSPTQFMEIIRAGEEGGIPRKKLKKAFAREGIPKGLIGKALARLKLTRVVVNKK